MKAARRRFYFADQKGLMTTRAYAPDFKVRPDDYTILMGVDARLSGGVRPARPDDHIKWDVVDWNSPAQTVTWEVDVPREDHYRVQVLLCQESPQKVLLEVACGATHITGIADPAKPRLKFWKRLPLDGTLRLPQGKQTLILRARSLEGTEPFALILRSIELVRPDVHKHLHQEAVSQRADVTWLQDCKFGIMAHWVPESYPRHGDRLPYDQAVAAFDVERFASQIEEAGARFAVLVTAHAKQYFPAPIKALDRILPGRTTSRDLIADLITALDRRGLKLMLYYHLGSWGDPEWCDVSGFSETDSDRFFQNWSNIVGEIGHRYGDKLTGWWFDDGTANYYYRGAPWSRLYQAAKAGCPTRLVSFNSYLWPVPTDFMDYFTGECFDDPAGYGWLLRNGNGIYLDGPGLGLPACATNVVEGDWVHDKRDTEIGPPRWDIEQLRKYFAESVACRNVQMLNFEIYQDGSFSPKTVELFAQAKSALIR